MCVIKQLVHAFIKQQNAWVDAKVLHACSHHGHGPAVWSAGPSLTDVQHFAYATCIGCVALAVLAVTYICQPYQPQYNSWPSMLYMSRVHASTRCVAPACSTFIQQTPCGVLPT